MCLTMRGFPKDQSRCRFSVGIGHDSSKEAENRLSGINGLLICPLGKRLGKALAENLFSVFWPRWRLWPWDRVGHIVHIPTQPLNVARMITHTEFVLDQARDLTVRPRLALFEESLEVARLLV